MDKASLRRHMRVRLYALSDDEISQKSNTICDTVIQYFDWQSIKHVSCYKSNNSLREVDTSGIIDYLRNNWPNVALDIIPSTKEAALPNKQYNLIFVPVLGFDSTYNRLGRGSGWYDRFLSTQDSATKVGLAFDCQSTDNIPIEDFDIELDEIITES